MTQIPSYAMYDTGRRRSVDLANDFAVSASDDPEGHPQLFWWETLNATNTEAMAALQSLTDRFTTAFNGDEVLGKTAAFKQLWRAWYRAQMA